jgi:hypothetical protein
MTVRRLTLIAAAILSAAVVAPTAAQAGSALCPAARACIYIDRDFVGLLGTKSGGSGLTNVSSSANDRTSSWENKTTSNGAWFFDVNGGGNCRDMRRGTELAALSNFGSADELSSWRMTGLC